MIKVEDFEAQVWALEGIRIIVRAEWDFRVEPYPYKKASKDGINVTKWVKDRVMPYLKDLQVIVIQGNGEQPHGGTLIRNVKASYHQAL
jgi:hypothetical protein